MTLSKTSKGACKVIVLDKEAANKHQIKTTKLHQIIDDVVEGTSLNKTEAISTIAILLNTIENHLINGHNVNLGTLGTLCISDDELNNEQTADAMIHFVLEATLQKKMEKNGLFKREIDYPFQYS